MTRGWKATLIAWISGILILILLNTVLCADSGRNRNTPAEIPNVKGNFENHSRFFVGAPEEEEIQPVQARTLDDHDLVAPKPDPDRFGEASSAAQLEQVLADAQFLHQEGPMLFTTQTAIKEGSAITYYLDETIFAVTWKQVVDNGVYTFSEVMIAHPSQFRRFFSDGVYGSKVLHTTTEMSESVNAVVASSGDYYGYRSIGIVVNEGQVCRDRGELLDTCYIDDKGDLLFTRANEISGKEEIQNYVDARNVRFSICFGPVMIEDGQCVVPRRYNSGEIWQPYARAALCQMGPLHYVVAVANNENPNLNVPNIQEFAERLQEMGIPKAYALDGGQTASIVMNNHLINSVSYGSQRKISDIFYFATAVPETNIQEGRP